MTARNRMIDDVVFRFTVNGREKKLEYQQVPLRAWSELKQAIEFTPQTLISALGDQDVEAIVALIWLERKQRERALGYRQVMREVSDDPPDVEIVGLVVNGNVIIGDEDDDEDDEEERPTTGGST